MNDVFSSQNLRSYALVLPIKFWRIVKPVAHSKFAIEILTFFKFCYGLLKAIAISSKFQEFKKY